MNKPLENRFELKRANLQKAFKALEVSTQTPISEPRDLSGIIKDFEIVYELAWKALKAFMELQGHETKSAKDVFAQAYQLHYLSQESVWLQILADRNLTVHTYDETFARQMCDRIRADYVPAFRALLHSIS
jgi:nucleotidyltransferase substrate binding protein (TIGR01987 family)